MNARHNAQTDDWPSQAEIYDYWASDEGQARVKRLERNHDIKLGEQLEADGLGAKAAAHCWACGVSVKGSYTHHGGRGNGLERCHVIPRAMGGDDRPSNFVLMCKGCHADNPDSRNADTFWAWFSKVRLEWHYRLGNAVCERSFSVDADAVANDYLKEMEREGPLLVHGVLSKGTSVALLERVAESHRVLGRIVGVRRKLEVGRRLAEAHQQANRALISRHLGLVKVGARPTTMTVLLQWFRSEVHQGTLTVDRTLSQFTQQGVRLSIDGGLNQKVASYALDLIRRLCNELLGAESFRDSRGAEIRSYEDSDLDITAGLNHFDWDMRYEKADDFDGLLMWWGTLNGPVAPPGNYTVELALDRDTLVSSFEVLMDPRAECTREDRISQFEFLKSIRDKVDETHDAIRHMRSVKSQSSALLGRLDEDDYPAIFEEARALDSLMTAVEEVLYQTKLKSNQDMLNFPIKLNNKLAHVGSLASMGVYAPTEQMVGVRDEVTALIDAELAKWHTLRDERLPAFNALIRDSAIDLIGVPEE